MCTNISQYIDLFVSDYWYSFFILKLKFWLVEIVRLVVVVVVDNVRLCTTKENHNKVELYSIHSNPFKSEEFCLGGRDRFVR